MKNEKLPDIICFQCQHLDTLRIGGCKAFPGEIPDIILSGRSDHSLPLKGQEGDYVFTPIQQPIKLWRRIEKSARQARKHKKQPEFK